jgi:uncharacterized delta-60 repeat protein
MRQSVRRVVFSLVVLACVTSFAQESAQNPAPGSLDTSFGDQGKTLTVVDQGSAAGAIVVQQDLRIVLAGSAWNGQKANFGLARYLVNGNLDTPFGTNGTISTSIGSVADTAVGVGVDGQGNIVAAGFTNNGDTYDFGLARYTSSGELDPTFGSGGKVATDFGGSFDFARGGVLVQPDGKPVALGEVTVFGTSDQAAVARYTTAGALDPTFGSGGFVHTLYFNTVNNRFFGGALQSDGKIIGTGHAEDAPRLHMLVARYNADGSLDASFGSGGTTLVPFGGGELPGTGRAVALQSDGKIVIAGSSTTPNKSYPVIALARLLPNGTLDASFGTEGRVLTPRPGPILGSQDANAVAIQGDGKILVAGYQDDGYLSQPKFLIARYMPDGTLDAAFGQGGLSVISVGGGDAARALAIQPSGRILVAGSSTLNGLGAFALIRIYQ